MKDVVFVESRKLGVVKFRRGQDGQLRFQLPGRPETDAVRYGIRGEERVMIREGKTILEEGKRHIKHYQRFLRGELSV